MGRKKISIENKARTVKIHIPEELYKKLEEKGLIENKKVGSEDYIRITEKGKQWTAFRVEQSVFVTLLNYLHLHFNSNIKKHMKQELHHVIHQEYTM